MEGYQEGEIKHEREFEDPNSPLAFSLDLQMKLAEEMEEGNTAAEKMMNWTKGRRAEDFRHFLDDHPDFQEAYEQDPSKAFEEIKKHLH
jgi:hypothetical protein